MIAMMKFLSLSDRAHRGLEGDRFRGVPAPQRQPEAKRRTPTGDFLAARGMIEDQGKKVAGRGCGVPGEPKAIPGLDQPSKRP